MSERRHTIAIIGGGFCGTMTAVHLLRSPVPLHIVMINAGYPLSKGLAYSSYSHKHLLNVPARRMSAFADKPSHFIDWIRQHENYRVINPEQLPDMFLPRNIYGYYLKDVFENAIRKKPEQVSISFVHDEAIDVEIRDETAYVLFSVSPAVPAHQVVLATGNPLPAPVNVSNPAFASSPYYFGNPWLHDAVNHPDPEREILIIGNGLTMADVVIGLQEKKHAGKIYSLSINGFNIVPHRSHPPYHDLLDELEPPYRLDKLIRLISRHIHHNGASGEAIVESLRPMIREIWMSWTLEEKKWFLEHTRHLWEVTRHRLPEQVHNKIQQLIIENRLEIIAGRILDMSDEGDGVRVRYRRKRDQKEYTLHVSRVINCTGPQADITKIDRPLYKNLLLRNLVRPDTLRLGFSATLSGALHDGEGNTPGFLYTLGSNLKGLFWESTAVPELREQAQALATLLVEPVQVPTGKTEV